MYCSRSSSCHVAFIRHCTGEVELCSAEESEKLLQVLQCFSMFNSSVMFRQLQASMTPCVTACCSPSPSSEPWCEPLLRIVAAQCAARASSTSYLAHIRAARAKGPVFIIVG